MNGKLYDTEQNTKAMFITEYGELLSKYDDRSGVKSLEYSVLNGCTEILSVNFTDGSHRDIDVTGDSIIAITHDIYKALI